LPFFPQITPIRKVDSPSKFMPTLMKANIMNSPSNSSDGGDIEVDKFSMEEDPD
jgi:hypothetical protein